jgi:inhibitor of Bruton tyrosine kinase
MTLLHVYFAQRNQQAFQRLLDTPTRSQSGHGAPSTSGGKSWTRSSGLSSRSNPPLDVNARDELGRTVLHLAASATEAAAPEYVRKLLVHPHINVNLPDKENHWTALHRALYHGNLPTALILLQRPDIDISIKDSEGYTAFDLYNSTVEGTKPLHGEDAQLRAELFTWGANRNAALGHGDADDRVLPDQVTLEPVQARPENANVEERFAPVRVRQIVMSKLHTGGSPFLTTRRYWH